MKTQIFKNYQEFTRRENESVNGVSQDFVDKMKKNDSYYDYQDDNETNTGCWNCYNCTHCLNCVECIECNEIMCKESYYENSFDRERDSEAYNSFCEMIEKEYGSIKICGWKFSATEILEELTPRLFDDNLAMYIKNKCSH